MNDKILIKQKEKELERKGIILIESVVETPNEGEVLGISDMIEEKALKTLKIGDYVMYNKHAGMQINYQKNPYIIIDYQDIIAKIQ